MSNITNKQMLEHKLIMPYFPGFAWFLFFNVHYINCFIENDYLMEALLLFFIQKILEPFKLLQYCSYFKLISCNQLSSNKSSDSDMKRNINDVTKKRNKILKIASYKKCV